MDGIAFASIIESQPVQTTVSRRLSDKILAAFNHAFASGETEIADLLRQALESHEGKYGAVQDRRSGFSALGQADLWIHFVEARDHYKVISEDTGLKPEVIANALDGMKDAYKRWSLS